MKWFDRMRRCPGERACLSIDTFSRLFSFYVVPIAIGLFTLLVMLDSASAPNADAGTPLPMRVLSDPAGSLSPAAAAAALRAQPLRPSYDTHLSETPIWFVVDRSSADVSRTGQPQAPLPVSATLLATRHVIELICFDGTPLQPIGSVHHLATTGKLMRWGPDIAFVTRPAAGEVVCRARFSGPELLRATLLPIDALKRSNDDFHRHSGLLEGGLVTLAAFVLLTALLNRDWVYVLFAAWLFGNLRLGAISMGWDEFWLSYPIPTEWVYLVRKITVPVYYILTCTLFKTLFKHDLPRIGYQGLLQGTLYLGPLLLVASVTLAVPLYLPVMWGIVSFTIAVLVFMLGRLLFLAPSRTALWYSAALGVALLASLSEVAGAALKAPFLTHALNSVTAALVSSLMAALAIAEQIRAERSERVRAEAELKHT